jgi:hypothetical protein
MSIMQNQTLLKGLLNWETVLEIGIVLLLAEIKQVKFLLTPGSQNFRFKYQKPTSNKCSLHDLYQYFHNTLLLQSGSEMI